ncbi:MAG: KOW domain-containing RNA-binding protein [Oscillospiraceae bacterium]|nr:KOW domain-containing RNA-binding protein [Oscillospiraceae bacterium]
MDKRMRNDGIRAGAAVEALAGRDAEKNGIYVVVGADDNFIYIANGRRRKLEKPKRKNPRHLRPTGRVFVKEEISTNRQIRQALRTIQGQ